MAVSLSDHETRILGLAMQCIKGGGKPDIDYNKLMTLAGHTNAGSTRNKMAAIFKKLDAGSTSSAGEENNDPNNSVPATPSKTTRGGKKATPAKRKAQDDSDAEAEADKTETPTKKAKSGAKAIKKETEDNADATEPATPKPAAAKKKNGAATPNSAAKKTNGAGTFGNTAKKTQKKASGSDGELPERSTMRTRSRSATPKSAKKGKSDAEIMEGIKEEEGEEVEEGYEDAV